MTTDVERLIVVLEARTKAFENALNRANGVANRRAKQIEGRFQQMNSNLSSSFQNTLRNATAILGVGFSTREIIQYADSWTTAKNKIAAASQVAGLQTRTLEELNVIANETRSGISETADLYAKLMRSTKGVAQSEMEVAKATEIVNKAFKAGGAAASEQAAGILQLGQGLGSGMLQGDELRSVRENAPLLAQAIADYFKVSIAGLKELGSEGQLTSDKVFKAILSAQPQIEAAFGKTNSTISDGITKVNNAMTMYIGQTDESLGATQRLVQALGSMADNFGQTADIVLKVAAVIASALIGRSILGMIRQLGIATSATMTFVNALRTASSLSGVAAAFGGVGAAAGPIGTVLGGAVVGALALYSANAAEASQRSQKFEKDLEALGLLAPKAADGIDEAAQSVKSLGDKANVQKIRSIADELERIRSGGSFGGAGDELNKIQGSARSGGIFSWLADDEADAAAKKEIIEITALLQAAQITTEEVRSRMEAVRNTPISDGVKDLADALDYTAQKMAALQAQSLSEGVMPGMDEAKEQITAVIDDLDRLERMEIITADQRKNLEDALIKLRDTGEGAEEARAALNSIGGLSFSTTLNGLDSLIGKVSTLYSQAAQVAALLGGMRAPNSGPSFRELEDRSMSAYREMKAAGDAFLAEAQRRNSLTKTQLSLENEIAKVRKDADKAGVVLTDKQIKAQAEANIAADARRSAEGRKPKKERKTKSSEDKFSADIENMAERTAAIVAETEAMRQLNPLIDDYDYAISKARATHEMLNAAEKAGVEITPALQEKIAGLAEAYAQATAASNQLSESQEQAREAAEFFKGSMMDAFQSMIPAIETGNKVLDRFLNTLIEAVMQASLLGKGPLAGIFGGGGGGFLGGIGKFFGFADGGIAANGRPQPLKTFARGGVSRTAAVFGEAGPEAAVPLPDGRRIPVDLRMNGRPASGGTETVHVVLQDDSGRMAQIADQRIQTSTGTIVQISVQQSAKAVKAGFSSMLADAQARER